MFTHEENESQTTQDDDIGSCTMGFRNPLKEPRQSEEDERRLREARHIADKITELISDNTPVNENDQTRAIRYDDIIILLRHRTHAASFEKCLMEAGIPYSGIEKGTLLETLEVRDIAALLEVLTTPFNNLAVAQVLKSPIFALNDNVARNFINRWES